ncbi:MAG: hypothetical protein QM597_06520 [Aeromicrobium sp.]|uniref:hypothetical protein n=1 Tax=Aeromicrobium sp. TaxID=1871063 RepID=UPI0039E27236
MSRPLPPEIYRRRRIVVGVAALGLLVIVWLLGRALVGGDDAEPKPTATATTAQDLPEGTVVASLTTGQSACDPEKVRVTPAVPADQQAGGPVTVVLTISSTASQACVVEASAAQLVIVIDNGDGPVYDSTSCNASMLSGPVSLSPQWGTVTTVTWSGRVSGLTCSDSEAFVPGGDYTIKLGTLGGEPGEANFTLADPPATPEPVQPDPAATATPAPQ